MTHPTVAVNTHGYIIPTKDASKKFIEVSRGSSNRYNRLVKNQQARFTAKHLTMLAEHARPEDSKVLMDAVKALKHSFSSSLTPTL